VLQKWLWAVFLTFFTYSSGYPVQDGAGFVITGLLWKEKTETFFQSSIIERPINENNHIEPILCGIKNRQKIDSTFFAGK
jgi:hypothetical protein